ncbi:DUF2314 domain-containing protein [Stigmatella aurantiaca]|uniref:Conserved uncharacterized protein n=2 Tax=Stigmatella aurantiaca (strain DW4/3-1) TaxID=378806 RepID=E3FGP0_STIAD|nr:DUF2314 domain-containing protein [Stigmatella aurantiaca]ADO71559.1 conserved uncharacterized protein [Stigmatella aurantiaca DW4/3-1]
MNEIYLLAIEAAAPVSIETLRTTFASDEVRFVPDTEGGGFAIHAEGTRVEVRFDTENLHAGWRKDLLTGSEEARHMLGRAKGFYRISVEPGSGPQPTVPVFEALWCARTLMEHVPGVLADLTAYKLHDIADVVEITELDFDIRDHVNLHAVEAIEGDTPLWVHSHGMEKFGSRDLEIFHLGEDDLLPAETFLHELCTDLAFGQGPEPRSMVATSEGQAFMLVPSEEARTNLLGVPLETFEGHEALFLSVVSPLGRHNTAELLRPYRERFIPEPEERTDALRREAQSLLPAFLARFHRKGLMEPLTFLARAPFETHPEGETVVEKLWLEVVAWEEGTLVGKLVDGAVHTTEWRKGAHVEVDGEQINALAISREGRTLDEDEMRALLNAERPM